MPNFGNIQPQLDLEEHAIISGVPGKKVFVVDSAGNQITDFGGGVIPYEFIGIQTSGTYTYFGFKENGGTRYRVIRSDSSDDSAWKYAYGLSGWDAAWADPTALSYDDPPDA